MASAQPLMEAFIKNGIVVDQAAIGTLLSSKPDLSKVQDFARSTVDAASTGEAVKKELKEMIEGLKGVEGGEESGVALRKNNVVIEDLERFKASLAPSRAAMPIEPLEIAAKL
jgi:hypothetical protein